MKKIFLVFMVLFFALSINAQEVKKHNFGIGFGGSTFPIVSDFSNASNIYGGSMYDMTNAFTFTASLQYDFLFSKHLSISIQPTYIRHYLEFKDFINYESDYFSAKSHIVINQISIPAFLNFSFRVIENVNLISSLGLGALINTKSEIDFSKSKVDVFWVDNDNTISLYDNASLNINNKITPEVLVRLGIELATKHKIQLMTTYRFASIKNYKFVGDYGETIDFRVTMLEFGFNLFL